MVKKTEQQAADYIVPLDINGMQLTQYIHASKCSAAAESLT